MVRLYPAIHSDFRGKEILTQAATCISLEDVRLHEIIQSQKETYYVISLI